MWSMVVRISQKLYDKKDEVTLTAYVSTKLTQKISVLYLFTISLTQRLKFLLSAT